MCVHLFLCTYFVCYTEDDSAAAPWAAAEEPAKETEEPQQEAEAAAPEQATEATTAESTTESAEAADAAPSGEETAAAPAAETTAVPDEQKPSTGLGCSADEQANIDDS